MADDAAAKKDSKNPVELLIAVVLGLLTIVALLLILTDLQGWI